MSAQEWIAGGVALAAAAWLIRRARSDRGGLDDDAAAHSSGCGSCERKATATPLVEPPRRAPPPRASGMEPPGTEPPARP